MNCYSCCNFYKEGCFGSYSVCMCKIYGSLDADQRKRHPSTAAINCKMYNIPPKTKTRKNLPKWEEKIPEPFIDF